MVAYSLQVLYTGPPSRYAVGLGVGSGVVGGVGAGVGANVQYVHEYGQLSFASPAQLRRLTEPPSFPRSQQLPPPHVFMVAYSLQVLYTGPPSRHAVGLGVGSGVVGGGVGAGIGGGVGAGVGANAQYAHEYGQLSFA